MSTALAQIPLLVLAIRCQPVTEMPTPTLFTGVVEALLTHALHAEGRSSDCVYRQIPLHVDSGCIYTAATPVT